MLHDLIIVRNISESIKLKRTCIDAIGGMEFCFKQGFCPSVIIVQKGKEKFNI